jgi:hypothetical protein
MTSFFEKAWLFWWAIAFGAVIRYSYFCVEGVRSGIEQPPTKRDEANSNGEGDQDTHLPR